MLRRTALIVAFALSPILAVVACSDPPAKPAPAVGGSANPPNASGGGVEGGSDAGLIGIDAEGGVCNDVVITSNLIDRLAVPTEPPVATGGTVEDGLYNLTDYTAYVGVAGVGGPTGITAKWTIRIAAGKLDEAYEIGGTGKTTTNATRSSAYSATGASIARTELCPTVGGGAQLQFTANPPLLVLTDLGTKEAFTFTKR